MASSTQTITTANMSAFLKDRMSKVKTTPLADIPKIVAEQRDYFNTGATRPLSFRKEQMRKLFYMVSDNADSIVAALRADLGKHEQEAFSQEITLTLQDIINVVKNIDHWAKDEYVPVNATFKFNKCRIRKEPLGVVLVMGPWNFPIWCTLCPVLNAMAAGNAVILKPSEHAPHTSTLLEKLVTENFSPNYFTVVTGAIPVSSALLAQKYDHIVYTGGSHGAHFVAAAAAKYLTPYTLELGGKNPCIIDTSVSDSKLEMYASRVMWGKFSNAGQICIGSDHVILVGSREREERFLAYAKKAADRYAHGGTMARIVNEAHFERLQGLVEGTQGQVVHGGDFTREDLRVGITIVSNVQTGDVLMGDEIFGPLLPVLRVDTLEQGVNLIRETETPLALYIFSQNRGFIDTVMDRCPSGSVTVNDTIMQAAVPNLPFGGVGASGVGFYRSKYGFLRFVHLRSVTETPTWGFMEKILQGRYPPFSVEKMKKMEKLTGKPNPPFTHAAGSADRPQGASGWVYFIGLAVITGLAGVLYRQKNTLRG